jgi:hypothetical protein
MLKHSLGPSAGEEVLGARSTGGLGMENGMVRYIRSFFSDVFIDLLG